jgi:GGDEF domain-containing protein
MSIPALTPAPSGSPMPALMLSNIIDNTLNIVARLFQTRLAIVSKIEGTVYTVMAVVDQQRTLRPGTSYQLQHTFCKYMLASGKPLRIDDVGAAPQPLSRLPELLKLDIRAYLGVPLCMLDGRIFGTLWTADSAPYCFSEQDTTMLQMLARLLIYELDRDAQLRHTERIQQMAVMQIDIDPLTGLVGYNSFEAGLAQEIAQVPYALGMHAVAVLRLEPNLVPTIQPAQHANLLHQGLAGILMRTARIVDRCSRISANEFAVLIPNTTPHEVAAWRHRIEAEIEAWNSIHAASDLWLNTRIGLADTNERSSHKLDGPTLLKLARQRSQPPEVQT